MMVIILPDFLLIKKKQALQIMWDSAGTRLKIPVGYMSRLMIRFMDSKRKELNFHLKIQFSLWSCWMEISFTGIMERF